MAPRRKRKQGGSKDSGQPKRSKPDSSNFIVDLVGGVSDSDNDERNERTDEIKNPEVMQSIEAEGSVSSTNQGSEEEEENEEPSDRRISIDSLPIYVDVASQTAYYLFVNIVPPYSEYVRLNEEEEDHDSGRETSEQLDRQRLTVRVGDTVIVHSDSAPLCFLSARGAAAPVYSSKYAWYPFHVPWSPAEVVSIWRKFSRAEAVALRQRLTGDKTDCGSTSKEPDDTVESDLYEEEAGEYVPPGGGEIMMEVRWLYRTSEVPVISSDEQAMYEEVFETDHVDQCSMLCLLAPLMLCASPNEQSTPHQQEIRGTPAHRGIPRVSFYCHRFWSVRRRCLVPVGSLASRAARGRLHSHEIQRNHALKIAIESALGQQDKAYVPDRLQLASDGSASAATSTLGNQHSSSKQLLTEAASAFALSSAALDAHSLGIPLRGRENEQRRISNFLRLAIRSGNGRSNCTMFCAGPVSCVKV